LPARAVLGAELTELLPRSWRRGWLLETLPLLEGGRLLGRAHRLLRAGDPPKPSAAGAAVFRDLLAELLLAQPGKTCAELRSLGRARRPFSNQLLYLN
jgi:hypothetical protein